MLHIPIVKCFIGYSFKTKANHLKSGWPQIINLKYKSIIQYKTSKIMTIGQISPVKRKENFTCNLKKKKLKLENYG